MCANATFMFQGEQRKIIIKPGGKLKAAVDASLGGVIVIDVRHQFEIDTGFMTAQGGIQLKIAAERIRAALNNGAKTIIVQCEKGMSRSPRCVGAFLMLHGQFSYNGAMQILIAGYKARSDDCIQKMSETMVRNWLSMMGTIK